MYVIVKAFYFDFFAPKAWQSDIEFLPSELLKRKTSDIEIFEYKITTSNILSKCQKSDSQLEELTNIHYK